MMLQARQHNEEPSRVVFFENFNSEQETRLKGGVPTNVIYDKGVAICVDTSIVDYPVSIPSGIYTIRIVIQRGRTPAGNRYFLDFRTNSGTGYIVENPINNLAVSNGTRYINGVASSIVDENMTEIVVSGITLEATNIILNAYYTGAGTDNTCNYKSVEIYEGTLSAEAVANLYSG